MLTCPAHVQTMVLRSKALISIQCCSSWHKILINYNIQRESHLSLKVHDIKNIFGLFERPFEIQKNGVFVFEIYFPF